jgi:hypothetical protein
VAKISTMIIAAALTIICDVLLRTCVAPATADFIFYLIATKDKEPRLSNSANFHHKKVTNLTLFIRRAGSALIKFEFNFLNEHLMAYENVGP